MRMPDAVSVFGLRTLSNRRRPRMYLHLCNLRIGTRHGLKSEKNINGKTFDKFEGFSVFAKIARGAKRRLFERASFYIFIIKIVRLGSGRKGKRLSGRTGALTGCLKSGYLPK